MSLINRGLSRLIWRPFSTHSVLRMASPTDTKSSTSIFGSLTQDPNKKSATKRGTDFLNNKLEEKADQTYEEIMNEGRNDVEKILDPKDDIELQKYLNPKPYITTKSLLSPLKKKIYAANVKKNGFFKNNELIKLSENDESTYRLKLTREEIEALEPSIYLRSWRIKSSVKKTNIVLRALKGLPLKRAITELHFMEKKVARDLSEMLERGLKDCKAMHYNPDEVYISESWVCTDGKWSRRVDAKGRGRTGIIRHRYVNVRFLLKTNQTKLRLEADKAKKLMNKTPSTSLNKEPIRGAAPGFYRW